MSSWKPSDKEWVKERKKQWRIIKKSLLRARYFVPREDIPYLEAYFIKGLEPDEYIREFVSSINLFYKLWFHPDQSHENWQGLIAEADLEEFREARRLFKCHNNLYFISMDGLEQRFFEGWFLSIGRWLVDWGTNPYCSVQYLNKIAWRCLASQNKIDFDLRMLETLCQ